MVGGMKDRQDCLDECLERLEDVVRRLEYFINAFLNGEKCKDYTSRGDEPSALYVLEIHYRQGYRRRIGSEIG